MKIFRVNRAKLSEAEVKCAVADYVCHRYPDFFDSHKNLEVVFEMNGTTEVSQETGEIKAATLKD